MVEGAVARHTLLRVVCQEALQELKAQLGEGLVGKFFAEVAHRTLDKLNLWKEKNSSLFFVYS